MSELLSNVIALTIIGSFIAVLIVTGPPRCHPGERAAQISGALVAGCGSHSLIKRGGWPFTY